MRLAMGNGHFHCEIPPGNTSRLLLTTENINQSERRFVFHNALTILFAKAPGDLDMRIGQSTY